MLTDSNNLNTFEKTSNMRTIKLEIPDNVDLNDREAKRKCGE